MTKGHQSGCDSTEDREPDSVSVEERSSLRHPTPTPRSAPGLDLRVCPVLVSPPSSTSEHTYTRTLWMSSGLRSRTGSTERFERSVGGGSQQMQRTKGKRRPHSVTVPRHTTRRLPRDTGMSVQKNKTKHKTTAPIPLLVSGDSRGPEESHGPLFVIDKQVHAGLLSAFIEIPGPTVDTGTGTQEGFTRTFRRSCG